MEFAYPSLFTYFLPINYLQTFFTSHKSRFKLDSMTQDSGGNQAYL